VGKHQRDRLKASHQLGGRHAERFRELNNRQEAGVTAAVLDAVDLGRVEVGAMAKGFLGESSVLSC